MEDQDRTRLEGLFEENCTDGVVTKDAFKVILQCMGNDPTESQIEEVFSNFDSDEIAGLSKEEFDEWISKCWVPQSEARKLIVESFRTIFKDQESDDGRYPIDTLIEILQTRGEEKLDSEDAECFRKELVVIDKNGDGNIDEEELALFLHAQESQQEETENQEEEQTEEVTETTEEVTETQEETQEEETQEGETQEGETQEGETQEETQEEEKQEETQEEETKEEETQEETKEETQEETQEGETQEETQDGEGEKEATGGEDSEKVENTEESENTETKLEEEA